MRNPLILWSLYLIPIFSESEHIEQTPAINPCLSEPEEWTSQIFPVARHVVMGWTYRLWAALSWNWQKYFTGCQDVKSTVRKSDPENTHLLLYRYRWRKSRYSFTNHILMFWEVLPKSNLPSLVYGREKKVRVLWRRFEIVKDDMCWLVWGRAFKRVRRLQR